MTRSLLSIFTILVILTYSLVHSSSRNKSNRTGSEIETIYEEDTYEEYEVAMENSCRNDRAFDSMDDLNDPLELPVFVNEVMTRGELRQYFLDLLLQKFKEPMAISIYFTRVRKEDDFYHLAMIMDGMIRHKRMDVFEEMTGLWGYFISLQKYPDQEVLTDLKALICDTGFQDILEGLLKMCKSLNLLSSKSKKTLVENVLLRYHEVVPKLSLVTLGYLFDVDEGRIKRMLKNFGYSEYRAENEYENFRIEPYIFHDLMTEHT